MKLGKNIYLMRWLFSPSFINIEQKLWIFYLGTQTSESPFLQNYDFDNHLISNLCSSIRLLCHSWFILRGPHHKLLLIKIAPPPHPWILGALEMAKGAIAKLIQIKKFWLKTLYSMLLFKKLERLSMKK